MSRRLSWLAGTLVVAEVVYLIAGNLFLYFGLRGVLSRSPDDMLLGYDSAYTTLPGVAHVRGLRLRRQDDSTQWRLALDEADVTVELTDLFHRKFHASRVRATGVSFRLRRRLTDEGATAPRAAALPPIDGFDDPPLLPIGPEPDPNDAGPGWTVELQDVLAALGEVWVDEWRLLGPATVRGGFFKSKHLLQLGPASLAVDGGTGEIAHETALADLRTRVDVMVGAIDMRWPIARAVLEISMRGTLDARVPSVDFVRVYLGKSPPVELQDGSGPLHIELAMKNGLAEPPSNLTLESDRVVVTKSPLTATSSFSLAVRVEPTSEGPLGTGDLTLRRATVELAGHEGAPPVIEAGHIHWNGLPIRLAAPVEVERTTIDLPVRVPELAWMLPPPKAGERHPTRLAGAATATAHVDLDRSLVASGTVEAHTDHAAVTVREYVIGARVSAKGGFERADYRAQSLVLQPGVVLADQVGITRSGRVHEGGTTRVDVRSGRVERGVPRDVALTIAARHPDLGWLDHDWGKAGLRPRSGAFVTELLVGHPASLLEGTPEDARVSGTVDATATGDAHYADAKLSGRARTRAVLEGLDLGRRTLSLRDTHVELRDVTIERGASRTEGWWGNFDAPTFTGSLGHGAELAARIDTRCASAAPFSALLVSAGVLPGWVGTFFPMNDLAVSGRVSLRDGLVDFGLGARGSSGTVTADFKHANKAATGVVLAKTAVLSVGVDFAAGKANVKVFAGQAWLDQRIHEVETSPSSAWVGRPEAAAR